MISVTRKSVGIKNSKLKEIIISDFSNLINHQNELLGDIYFCALGTTIKVAGNHENFRKIDYDAILNFGNIAKHHQAKSLTVISASMADKNSSVFYNRVKGETEQAILSINLNRLIILRPGLLIGERSTKRNGEEFAIKLVKLLSPIIPDKIEKMVATTIEELTNCMINEGMKVSPKVKIINAKDI